MVPRAAPPASKNSAKQRPQASGQQCRSRWWMSTATHENTVPRLHENSMPKTCSLSGFGTLQTRVSQKGCLSANSCAPRTCTMAGAKRSDPRHLPACSAQSALSPAPRTARIWQLLWRCCGQLGAPLLHDGRGLSKRQAPPANLQRARRSGACTARAHGLVHVCAHPGLRAFGATQAPCCKHLVSTKAFWGFTGLACRCLTAIYAYFSIFQRSTSVNIRSTYGQHTVNIGHQHTLYQAGLCRAEGRAKRDQTKDQLIH